MPAPAVERLADLRGLVETLPLVVYTAPVAEHDARPRFISPQVEDVLGLSPAEFSFHRLRDGIHPDDRAEALAAFDAADAAGADLSLEYRFVRPDGRIVWIEDASRVVEVDGEQLAQGYLLDITSRKRTEAAAARRAATLGRLSVIMRRSLEDASRDDVILSVLGLLEHDIGAEISAFLEPVGDELVVTHALGWAVEGVPAPPGTPAFDIFQEGTTYAGPTFAPSGAPLAALEMRSSIAAPVRNVDGLNVGVLAVHSREKDAFGENEAILVEHVAQVIAAVIERDRVGARLRAAHRLESVGQLAAGIAHDFNNMLTVIAGHAAFATKHADAAGRGHLGHVLDAAERARTLTAQLLAFSRKQMLQPKPVRLDLLAAGLRPMLETLLGENVRLVVSGDEVTVLTDEAQIENVLVNLVANARDAMPDGGSVSITAGRRDVDDHEALLHEVAPGCFGTIAVADTGVGMPPTVLERIFEPFFTTKEHGAGTGLGLAGAYGVVRQSGGFITVASTPGEGSVLTINLPWTEAAPAPGQTPASDHATGRRARVLVVEDEAVVRGVVVEQLRQMGHDVEAVADGTAALARLDAEPFEAVVSDVGLPGMDGAALADAIAGRHPDVRVVLASGYPGDYLDARHNTRGVPLLQKPFTAAELESALASVLG